MIKKLVGNHPLAVIFLTIFVDLLGFGILIPVIPLLLADPRSAYFLLPTGMTVGRGYVLLGFLSAVFPICQFVATPILGQLSDSFGRKKILAVSLGGTCVSYVLFAIGIMLRNIPLLFAARALDGITGGNIAVAQAAIADITPPQLRAKNFGLVGAAFGLGFIIGPFLGGKLSDPHVVSWFTAATPFWFAAILSFCNVLSVLLFFPETLTTLKEHVSVQLGKSVRNVVRGFTLPSVRLLFGMTFFLQGGMSFMFTFFSVFLIRRFGMTQGNIGDFFAFIGIWVAFTQMFLTRKIASRIAEFRLLKITLLGVSLAMVAYLFPRQAWQLFLVVPVFAIFNGLTQTNLLALVSRSVDSTIQGEILGINASVQALAQSIPPILSGFLAAKLAPEAPIGVAAGIIFFAWILFVSLYRPPLVAAKIML